MALQCLKARLVGQPKTQWLDEREYYVFDIVVMKEGVVFPASAQGPTLFRGKDIWKYAPAFDSKPITLGHPQNRSGRYISAASPQVLSRSKVGFVLNNRFKQGFLHAKAWIDKKKIIAREPRFLEYVGRGMRVEVSSGLVSSTMKKRGVFQGKRYTQVATQYRPDHVALLMDDIGACSVADGCGLLVAKKGISPTRMKRLQDAITSAWNGKHSSCSCNKTKGTSMKTKKASRKKKVNRLIAMKVGWTKSHREWLSRLDGEDFGQLLVQAKKLKPVNSKIKAQQKPSRRNDDDADDEVEEKPRRKTSTKKKGKPAKRSRKDRLVSKSKTSKKKKRINLSSILANMTAAQVVKAMPGRLGEVFANGLKAHGSNRKRLIDIIVSSEGSEFEKDELRDETLYPLSTLRKLAKLAIRNGDGEQEDEYAPFMAGMPGGMVASHSRKRGRESKQPHLIMPELPLPDSDEE